MVEMYTVEEFVKDYNSGKEIPIADCFDMIRNNVVDLVKAGVLKEMFDDSFPEGTITTKLYGKEVPITNPDVLYISNFDNLLLYRAEG